MGGPEVTAPGRGGESRLPIKPRGTREGISPAGEPGGVSEASRRTPLPLDGPRRLEVATSASRGPTAILTSSGSGIKGERGGPAEAGRSGSGEGHLGRDAGGRLPTDAPSPGSRSASVRATASGRPGGRGARRASGSPAGRRHGRSATSSARSRAFLRAFASLRGPSPPAAAPGRCPPCRPYAPGRCPPPSAAGPAARCPAGRSGGRRPPPGPGPTRRLRGPSPPTDAPSRRPTRPATRRATACTTRACASCGGTSGGPGRRSGRPSPSGVSRRTRRRGAAAGRGPRRVRTGGRQRGHVRRSGGSRCGASATVRRGRRGGRRPSDTDTGRFRRSSRHRARDPLPSSGCRKTRMSTHLPRCLPQVPTPFWGGHYGLLFHGTEEE